MIEEKGSFGSASDVVITSLIVGIWQIGNALTGLSLRGCVDFAFPEPPYFARFAPLAPGPVRFDQPRHQLVFDKSILKLPLVLSDPADWNEAVAEVSGPQLILAGPGTGKTEFLARRVAHLLGTGVPASRILVLTFSRRAAAELEARISALLPRPVSGATASTFHSFAHRLVETQRHRRGEPMPVLLTGPEPLAARLRAEIPQWREVVTAARITVD